MNEQRIAISQPLSTASQFWRILRWVEWEAVIWVAGLVFLALGDPYSPDHFTLFLPYYLFGIQSPGYNLGHSITFLFHGQILESIQAHLLGIPAVIILSLRIVTLTRRMIANYPMIKKGASNV